MDGIGAIGGQGHKTELENELVGGAYMAQATPPATPQPPQNFGDNTGVHLTEQQRNTSIFC